MFSLDAAVPQVFDIILKDKKNHMYTHEIVPEFCVRFAIILQMSNKIKFWTSTPLGDDVLWYCTFCIAVNAM